MSSAEVIRIGHGGTILLQLQAESMDTGAVIPVPESQMAAISRVVLQLASGKSIDSDVAGLGAAQAFDHTIDQTAGKLALTLGPTAQIVGFEGNYARGQHLDIYFGTAYPIEFPCPPIKILPAD